jgi:hypothetical protein
LELLATLVLALSFDHSAFDSLLKRYVSAGAVDYDGFRRAPEFRAYLDRLDAADPAALPDAERLAFWINVYNAYTIELINRHGERDSIRNIDTALAAGKGPWREMLVRVGGQLYHLDNVEHDIIRRQFREPRIHFALVCAAMSCPHLRSEAYTGAKLEAQLEDQARLFLLHSPKANRVDAKAGILHASPIFKWFREDFGPSDAAVGAFIARYLPHGPERTLLQGGGYRLVETAYDWTLNSQEKARAAAAKR